MTQENVNIVLANTLSCVATFASKVSKLFSIGNKCASLEFIKLKILIDQIEYLKCHDFSTDAVNCLTQDEADILLHEVMESCEICDCQLNQ